MKNTNKTKNQNIASNFKSKATKTTLKITNKYRKGNKQQTTKIKQKSKAATNTKQTTQIQLKTQSTNNN